MVLDVWHLIRNFIALFHGRKQKDQRDQVRKNKRNFPPLSLIMKSL